MSVEISITDQIVEINEVSNPVEISVAAGSSVQPTWGNINGTLSNQTDLQNALNAKVPYSGATANVDLGEYELKAGQIELDQTPTGVAGVAVTRWNDSVGTIETTLKGGSVVLKHGRDMFERVVNKTGIQLTRAAYQAVRVSDAQGQRLAVSLAQANNDNNSADTIGLVVETIDNNQEGYIYTVGEIDGVNTTGSLQGETWVDGDVLYLSPTTAGRITNVKPVAPQHLVVIGYVVYAHQNNGKIYVKVMNGWELGELHDVDTTGAVNGNVLKYNGTIWTPSGDVGITSLNGLNAVSQTFATGTSGTDFNISSATSTHTFNLPSASATNRGLLTSADWTTFNNKQNALTNPVTGTGASGQVAYFTGATTQSGSNNLFWDNTNGRLGIGTNAPRTWLHIASTTGGRIYLEDTDATNTYNITDLGNNLGNFAIATRSFDGGFVRTDYQISRDSLTSQYHRWYNGSGNEILRLHNTGNLHLGGTTDSGQRLQVTGDTLLKGSGNTSATNALTVQDSGGTNIFRFRNDGVLVFGNSAATSIVFPFNTTYGIVDSIGSNLQFFSQRTTQTATNGAYYFTGSPYTQTSGAQIFANISNAFNPTSGTASYTILNVSSPTINQTGGANGITRGLYVNPTLTSAADWRSIEWSNNTGFGLYGAGTATNVLLGPLTIGEQTIGTNILNVRANLTGSTIYNSVRVASLVLSDVTNIASAFRSEIGTQNAVFTLSTLSHFHARQGSFGASSIVTNQYGFWAVSNLTGATNNYGFYGDIASGTGRWNLYMNGTADNYMAGSLGIGSTSLTNISLRISKTITGVTTGNGIWLDGQVQSDVTSSYRGFRSTLNIVNSTFTLANVFHALLEEGTIGASSSVTNQYGLYVGNLTKATNNYGVYSEVASGTGRWNLYMGGTAANYLAGNLGIGSTSPTVRLQVENNENASNGIWTRNTNSGNAATSFFTTVSNAGQLNLIAHSTTHSVWANTAVINTTTGLTGGLTTFVGAGNYDVWTGNSLRMRLDASGNLGLGTTTIPNRLTVSGDAANTAVVSGTTVQRVANFVPSNNFGNAIFAFDTTNGHAYLYNGYGGGALIFGVRTAPDNFEAMRIFAATRNVGIGTGATDSGEKLQVNGTMRVSGASTFGGNMTLSLNQNAVTSLTISNTTDGTTAGSAISLTSEAASGTLTIGKRANLRTAYKILGGSDAQIYNSSGADISILNDAATGSIKMAAGGSSTAQWTIGSNGDLTAADGENIIVGSTNGTKLGTATSQKIGFWNATPIVQPTTAVASATRVGGAGNTVTDTDTYDGYTLPQIVKALRNAGLLA